MSGVHVSKTGPSGVLVEESTVGPVTLQVWECACGKRSMWMTGDNETWVWTTSKDGLTRLIDGMTAAARDMYARASGAAEVGPSGENNDTKGN